MIRYGPQDQGPAEGRSDRCLAWDQDRERARKLARSAGSAECEVIPVLDLRAAAAESDVIVTCTTSRHPFLAADMVRPGAFIAAVGADSPHKSEIEPELMARTTVLADILGPTCAG